ncbi:hypothetical protein LEP1GSC132_2597 [Leptospira kirschneri str. 200803703]|nr:hypothetical protein LEP1GSC064_3967 [Leptospira kirschneri serovar Grippotyphosa str. Moskva]EKR06913.1 hypothetical protein LEP1GSC122_3494 [Leptospira kirschneri serovar Valbuzzi str. 200702274]EMJ90448.1 hypothetical protein LEP1GSC198_1140 [Leptospira kirschneri str. JB]EMK19416.1 hypothetical protein LEP1GSC042_1821 [Leptospira kirschneri serovar Bim str. PUO 1247]EMN04078.1 hypothetical protein LEP1GSC046_0340 [Leptospira kirschneri serovar Bim str. 1051]EMN24751.1 hypothetical prote
MSSVSNPKFSFYSIKISLKFKIEKQFISKLNITLQFLDFLF